MAKDSKKENLLTSWKEIAAYINCDERTCLRWEKRYGLPVHCINETAKATVFAYKNELDRWLDRFTDSKSFPQRPYTRISEGKRIFYFLLAAFAALAALTLLLSRFGSYPSPAGFRIEKAQLVVLDEGGKELWRFDAGIENLESEREYRDHFQFKKRLLASRFLPHLIIKDINQDGRAEVLFSIQTQDEADEGRLFCFNHKGRILWEFQAGGVKRFGEEIFSADYRIHGIDVCDLEGDGNLEIVIIASHRFFFPTQLAVLDAEGHILGEYWNAGHLMDIAFVDLNEDGEMEILAAGLNNEYSTGCLVVFDWNRVKGSSPQGKDFLCQGCVKGGEKHYILFPRTDVDRLEKTVEAIDMIYPLKTKQIAVKTQWSAIYYIFNYNLELQDVHLSHLFKQKHRLAYFEGKIQSELDAEYEKRLAQGLLYFNGQAWSPSPSGLDLHNFPNNSRAKKVFMPN